MWDRWNIKRHSEANSIPFELKFKLPPLRKGSVILERDEIGRILSSQHL